MNTIPGYSIVREFEYKVANYCGAKHCLSACNATTGIWGAFYALGLSNAEIITTPLTWAGAFSGLKMLNCKFKFCDVEPDNLTINPDLIESLISPETKAVFSADFLGYPARLEKIKEICTKHDLLLIHDAASSFGSRYRSYYSGYFADVTILSFGAKKIFSIGEGGCILTDNDNLFDHLTKLLMHPDRQNRELNESNPFAFNTSINPLAAQHGVEHFDKRVSEIKSKQEKIAEWLKQNMANSTFSSDEPNYYKIVVPINQLAKHDFITDDLPFKSLVYNELGFGGYDNSVSYDCPIAANALNQYKIISIKT